MQNILGENYDRLRPRGAKAIRHGIAQIKACKNTDPLEAKRLDQEDESSQEINQSNLSGKYHDTQILAVPSPPQEVNHIQTLETPVLAYNAQTDTNLTTIDPAALLSNQDDGAQNSIVPPLPTVINNIGIVSPQDLIKIKYNNGYEIKEYKKAIQNPNVSRFGYDTTNQHLEKENVSLLPSPLVDEASVWRSFVKDDLFYEKAQPEIWVTSSDQGNNPQKDSLVQAPVTDDANFTTLGTGTLPTTTLSADNIRISNRFSSTRKSMGLFTKRRSQGTSQIDCTGKSKLLDSPRLMKSLSKYPLEEGHWLLDTLKRFSSSTSSTLSKIRSSCCSSNLLPQLTSAEDGAQRDSETQRISETQLPLSQDLEEPCVDVMGIKTHKHDHECQNCLGFHRVPPPNLWPNSMELPGDLIATIANTFVFNSDCELYSTSKSCLGRCDRCLLQNMSPDHLEEFSIPFAVRNYKNGLPIRQIWFPSSAEWSDRYDNSALHIAAALGADVKTLIEMCQSGLDINKTNTAGQTFMHLLAPKDTFSDLETNFSEGHIIWLARELRLLSFNFAKADILGETFLAPLHRRKCFPIVFWQSLLSWTCSNGSLQDYELKIRLVRGARQLSEHYGEHELLESPAVVSSRIAGWLHGERHSGSRVRKLLGGTEEDLAHLKHFEDELGRSCFQILAIPVKAPRSSEQHKAFAKSQLAKLRSPLRFGFDPNHHDIWGETPLMAFIRASEDTCFLEELLEHGAGVNARNYYGESALHIAIKCGRLGATRMLLEYKANVHARDKAGDGVIKVGEKHQRRAKNKERLYGSITACLVMTMAAGAVAAPSTYDEWSLPTSYSQCDHGIAKDWP